jgi:hypothetical protein
MEGFVPLGGSPRIHDRHARPQRCRLPAAYPGVRGAGARRCRPSGNAAVISCRTFTGRLTSAMVEAVPVLDELARRRSGGSGGRDCATGPSPMPTAAPGGQVRPATAGSGAGGLSSAWPGLGDLAVANVAVSGNRGPPNRCSLTECRLDSPVWAHWCNLLVNWCNLLVTVLRDPADDQREGYRQRHPRHDEYGGPVSDVHIGAYPAMRHRNQS